MATDVTFDTNMWIRLVNQPMREEHEDRLQIERVLRLVEAQSINPFFCDATLWESVDRNRRKEVLHEFVNPVIDMKSLTDLDKSPDATRLHKKTFSMQNKPDVSLNEYWRDDIEAALKLQFLFIKSLVPAFGQMAVDLNHQPIYKSACVPSNDELRNRFMAAEDELNRHTVGMSSIRSQVADALKIAPEKVIMVQMEVLSKKQGYEQCL